MADSPTLPLTCGRDDLREARFLLEHAAGPHGKMVLRELDARTRLIADLVGQVAALLEDKRALTERMHQAERQALEARSLLVNPGPPTP